MTSFIRRKKYRNTAVELINRKIRRDCWDNKSDKSNQLPISMTMMIGTRFFLSFFSTIYTNTAETQHFPSFVPHILSNSNRRIFLERQTCCILQQLCNMFAAGWNYTEKRTDPFHVCGIFVFVNGSLLISTRDDVFAAEIQHFGEAFWRTKKKIVCECAFSLSFSFESSEKAKIHIRS